MSEEITIQEDGKLSSSRRSSVQVMGAIHNIFRVTIGTSLFYAIYKSEMPSDFCRKIIVVQNFCRLIYCPIVKLYVCLLLNDLLFSCE